MKKFLCLLEQSLSIQCGAFAIGMLLGVYMAVSNDDYAGLWGWSLGIGGLVEGIFVLALFLTDWIYTRLYEHDSTP